MCTHTKDNAIFQAFQYTGIKFPITQETVLNVFINQIDIKRKSKRVKVINNIAKDETNIVPNELFILSFNSSLVIIIFQPTLSNHPTTNI